MGLRLVTASEHEGVHPLAPYYRDASLTPEGEQLRRDLARRRMARLWEREWRWFLATAIALCSLALSLWAVLYPQVR